MTFEVPPVLCQLEAKSYLFNKIRIGVVTIEEARFSSIPLELIYDTDLDEMRVLLYCAVCFSKWRSDRPISQLVSFCGLTPRTGEGKSNAKIKSLLKELVSSGYLTEDFNRKSSEQFAAISFDEYSSIINSRDTRGNKFKHWSVLLLFSHIRMRSIKSEGDIPPYYIKSYHHIAEEIGLQKRNIPSYADVLEELGLISFAQLHNYRDKFGEWHTGSILFVEGSGKKECSKNIAAVRPYIEAKFLNARNANQREECKHIDKEQNPSLSSFLDSFETPAPKKQNYCNVNTPTEEERFIRFKNMQQQTGFSGIVKGR